MSNAPITDELEREFAGKRVSSREAGAVWNLCRDLERELEEARKQRDKWKANHDNQVAINRTLRYRPDLGERTKLVDAITKQRDHYKAACDQYSEDEMLCKLQEITKQRDALAEALKRIMKLTTPDQNMPYCKDDRIHGIAEGALAATEGGSHVTLQG